MAIGTLSVLVFGLLAIFGGPELAYGIVIVPVSAYLICEPKRWPEISFLLFTLGVAAMPVVYGESDYGGPSPKQFWYWAAGLAAPAVFASVGIALRAKQDSLWKTLPRVLFWPALMMVLTALVSLVYGIARGGAQVTDSLRQGSGIAFLFLYLVLAFKLNLKREQIGRVLRAMDIIVVLYSVFYLSRYVPMIAHTGDLVRERSPVLYFAGLFAAVSLIRMLFFPIKHLSWDMFRLAILIAAAVLSGSRAVAISMLFTVAVFLYMRFPSFSRKVIGVAVLAGIVFLLNPAKKDNRPDKANSAAQEIVYRYAASPIEDTSSLARVAEMVSIAGIIVQKPILGLGMGARFVWIDPLVGEVETAFVDNGVGYLLLKMGGLGLIVFTWWGVTLTRKMAQLWRETRHWEWLALLVSLVFYLSFLPFGPSFFQFSYSFWIGMGMGFFYCAVKEDRQAIQQSAFSLWPSPQI